MIELLRNLADGLTWLRDFIGAWRLYIIVLGILAPLVLTMWFKFVPWVQDIADDRKRDFIIRCHAFVWGFVPVCWLWHGGVVERIVVGAIAGAVSPTLYAVLMWRVRKKRPALADKLSGDPRHFPDGPGRAGTLSSLAIVALAVSAVALPVSGRAAGQGAFTAEVRATVHDPLRGTYTYTDALEHLQYAGGLPEQWSLHTRSRQVTGTVVAGTHPDYDKVAPGRFRFIIEYRPWVQGRVFAAGFEK